jgi:hypothetical protein
MESLEFSEKKGADCVVTDVGSDTLLTGESKKLLNDTSQDA